MGCISKRDRTGLLGTLCLTDSIKVTVEGEFLSPERFETGLLQRATHTLGGERLDRTGTAGQHATCTMAAWLD